MRDNTQKKTLPTGQGLIGSVVLGALSVVVSAERDTSAERPR